MDAQYAPVAAAPAAAAARPTAFGAAPPPMPPFVQAAFAAARHEVTSKAKASGKPAPASALQIGAVPPPPQPPIVRMAVEAARSARKAASSTTASSNTTKSGVYTGSAGLLTSWEQEAELVRSMHLATGACQTPRPHFRARLQAGSDACNPLMLAVQSARVPVRRAHCAGDGDARLSGAANLCLPAR